MLISNKLQANAVDALVSATVPPKYATKQQLQQFRAEIHLLESMTPHANILRLDLQEILSMYQWLTSFVD